MKTYLMLMMASVIGLAFCNLAHAQEQTNEFLMTWNAEGYTTNEHGALLYTNLTQKTLIDKVAADNNLNPADLCFVYRPEKRDTAVVFKTNGLFVSDVYQTEYTFLDVTNESGSIDFLETLLNDEYHTNAIGSTFGLQQRTYNKEGYLIGYSYHGTFHCAFPEDNVVFTGTFATGARVKESEEAQLQSN